MGKISVFLQVNRKKTLTLVLDQESTTKPLFSKVSEMVHQSEEDIMLSCRGRMIQNGNQTLLEYEITNATTIVYLSRVSGGGGSSSQPESTSTADTSDSAGRDDGRRCVISWETSNLIDLPCGHPVTIPALASFIKSEVDAGKTDIQCPVCRKKLSAQELSCQLTTSQRKDMDIGLAVNVIYKNFNCIECPECNHLIHRKDKGLKIYCPGCKLDGTTYVFCWDCKQKWKNTGSSYTECGNSRCSPHHELNEALRTCSTKSVTGYHTPGTKKYTVPEIRACPNCRLAIKHKEGCTEMACSDCKTIFCFSCLVHPFKSNHNCTTASRQKF